MITGLVNTYCNKRVPLKDKGCRQIQPLKNNKKDKKRLIKLRQVHFLPFAELGQEADYFGLRGIG